MRKTDNLDPIQTFLFHPRIPRGGYSERSEHFTGEIWKGKAGRAPVASAQTSKSHKHRHPQKNYRKVFGIDRNIHDTSWKDLVARSKHAI